MSEKEQEPQQISVNVATLTRSTNMKKMLAAVINYNDADGKLNTPDFILAQYLFRALEIYEEGLKAVAVIPKDHPAAEQDMRTNVGVYIAEKSLENFISTTLACDSWHGQQDGACTHEGYNFKQHGRRCHKCGETLTDFGD